MTDCAGDHGTGRFATFATLLQVRGAPVDRPTVKLLDFGCGGGDLVKAAYASGIDAYGCDIDFSSEWVNQTTLAELRSTNRVRQIIRTSEGKASPTQGDPYRLPFDDHSFDIVISDQVFEHVRNYQTVIAELRRVMKPDAVMLHIFPPRYRPIEPHILIPLGGFFHPRWWLKVWAHLGLRNAFQKSMSASEVVADNERFLSTMVNYLAPSTVDAAFQQGFTPANVEWDFMCLSRRASLFLLPCAYRRLWCRCLFAVRN